MKSLKAKFRKSDGHEWSKNDERLLSAVEHGEADKVASLLAKKGASAVKLDAEGKSALHVAALRGQVECLAVILAHGVDVSVIDASGFTALHLAAKNNHQDCAKKLIQSKSVVDAPDGAGRTALHHAAACGNLPMVELLHEHKCPVNLKDAEGFTPLLLSARHAHADVCRTLVEWGSEVNARDKNGRTAVMLASESSCVAAVQVLVQRGADLRVADSLGHNVLHYAKLSGSAEVRNVLNSALQRLQADPEKKTPPKTPQHDQAARVNDDRSATPKKRKAPPPPPISPTQSAGIVSPPYLTPQETPSSTKSDTPKRFNYKEDEVRSMALKEEVEKLQEEKSMLLETIEDLKQIVEQTEPKAEHGGHAAGALVAALQAKVTALSLENQQLSQIIKKRPAPQGEEGQDDSRPNSIDSNASYHSTRADFEHPSLSEAELSEVSAVEEDLKGGGGGGGGGGSEEELLLLRETLHNVQSKLQVSQLEYRSLQARLSPVMMDERLQERSMLESVADLQSKLTTAQEKYLRAVQEVQTLRATVSASAAQGVGGGGGRRGSEQDDVVMQKVQKLKSCLELEVKEQRVKLAGAREQGERDAARIRDLEARLEIIANQDSHERESHGTLLEKLKKEKALMVEKYKEAQVDVKILQEAIKGMVPVESAAKDFEALKTESGEAIEGLQRRLRELSKSYSETKSELSAVRGQLKTSQSPEPTPEKPDSPTTQVAMETQLQAAIHQAEESEAKHAEALKEIEQLKQEMEAQAQATVSLGDHTQVVSSLGSAIKELEVQADALKQQLSQKALQVDALQNRLTVEQERTPDDTVPRPEHERLRQKLEAEAAHVTRQLQDALRKQDEMALEATGAWQAVKDGRAERQTLEELAATRLQENKALGAKQREAQDHISHLKKQVENHVASEREKNKKIDDLSKEVAKLKEALNSLSQLSYSGSAPKRQQQQLQQQQQNQQNQQLEALQQQVKQLQYQLTESKKQHHEIVSVYRMHLLYAVQGQMDEDVQKALRQILMMCKMSTDTK